MGFSMLLPQQTNKPTTHKKLIYNNQQQRESDFENEEYWIYISITVLIEQNIFVYIKKFI